MEPIGSSAGLRAFFKWHAEMGVDIAVGESPVNLFTPASNVSTSPTEDRTRQPVARTERIGIPVAPPSVRIDAPTIVPADEAVALARVTAAACRDVDALREAVLAFKGCSLKAGARSTVFAEGVTGAPLLVMGEAPGREEDEKGRPFVGRAGQLLDRMLAAIGYSRSANALISNVIYWRPPGNRAPTQVEMAICRPFAERLIELSQPKAVLLVGGAPTQALLGLAGITRARGAWRQIETSGGMAAAALPTLHPAFLLRQPQQKRVVWRDLLSLEARLSRS